MDLEPYLATPNACQGELQRLYHPEAPLIIFDIGSCEGEDSIRYSRLFPRARVYAFEPLAANQALIRENFRKYGATRCELVPLALSEREGEAVLHVSSGAPAEKFFGADWNYGNKSSSLLAPGQVGNTWLPWLQFTETETIRTTTLDRFCAERRIPRIDFIHMDVQGAEWLVLQGAQRMLPHIRAVWMEVADSEVYRGQKLRSEIEAFMHARRFAVTHEDLRGVEGDQFYVNLKFLRQQIHWLLGPVRKFSRRVVHGFRRRLRDPFS